MRVAIRSPLARPDNVQRQIEVGQFKEMLRLVSLPAPTLPLIKCDTNVVPDLNKTAIAHLPSLTVRGAYDFDVGSLPKSGFQL